MKYLFAILLYCCAYCSVAQSPNRDSLIKFLKVHTSGDEVLNAQLALASIYIKSSDTTLAYQLLQNTLATSTANNHSYFQAFSMQAFSSYYLSLGNIHASDSCANAAIEILQNCKTELCMYVVANALSNVSVGKESKGDINGAINKKLEAMDIIEKINIKEKYITLAILNGGIGSLFATQGQYDKAAYYDKRALEAQLLSGEKNLNLGEMYIYLADDYMSDNKPDSAHYILQIAKALTDSLNIPKLNARYNAYSAKLYCLQKKYNDALFCGLKGRDYAIQSQSRKARLVAQLAAARAYIGLQQPLKAIDLLNEQLQLAQQMNSWREQSLALKELSNAYLQLKNPDQALHYLNQYMLVKDSLNQKQEKVKLNEIEMRYQAEKKENELLLMKKENQIKELEYKRSKTQNYLIIGVLFFVVLAMLFLWRNSQQQQIIQSKIIKELEMEKQVVAANSILQAQENERARMAQDLHDGLGGMLSSVKLNLSSMKGHLVIHESDANLFSKSIMQLDQAIIEMRRVAHNMMPEALLRLGLKEAVQDFCDDVNASNTVKMNFTSLSLTETLPKPIEVTLFRLIQELSNNAIKHAQASNVLIQLANNGYNITLTVEDDGQGFDPKMVVNTGSGLGNVESRINYYKGKMEIDSKPGQGTSIIIEIPIESE